MTAGFQAYTNTGLVQIDGTTPNVVLTQTLTVTTGSANMPVGKSNASVQYYFTANLATFTISATSPLIALYSPSVYATIISCINNGNGTWTVQIWSSSAASLTVYVFDQAAAAAPSGPGYGFQVFDQNGILLVDARQRMARVIDTEGGNIHSAGPGWGEWGHIDSSSASWTYSSVSKIGVAAMVTPFYSVPTGGSYNGYYNIGAFQTVGTTVNFLYQYYAQGNTSHPINDTAYGSQFNWAFMAIDLSFI